PKLVENVWSQGVPWWEKIGLKFTLPKALDFLKNGYNATEEGAEKALETIKDIFAKVEGILAGDNKYLVGDNFTAADITFAALSAPILRPKNHPVINSKLGGMPEEMLAVIKELRGSVAGKYALNLYKEKRYKE
uniref:glutathione binding-like protein n=1 Tax=Anaplasma marginale TaxID=770 RepID=UPI0018E9DC93